MSTMEKHVVQIFERTKRIIDQARHECHLWEHHLFPKLVLNGIVPPPWLCNSALHSMASDPKELNKDDLVSDVLLSQPQFRVPFPGQHYSQYSNLDVVSDDVQYPIGLHNEVHALKKDKMGDRLSNLPDYSVNDVGCASSGPPELNSGAISPQNQVEPRVSDSYHDPALSLAKLQRSKSRQRAFELRNSAKAQKRLSGGDNNAGDCAGTVTGSASSPLLAGHIKESDLVKDFHSNIQSCSREEVRRGDCQTQKDNNTGHITRSKSVSQKFNSLNVAGSSVVKEDGPLPNNLNDLSELANRPCFINGSCGVQEADKGEYQSEEAGSSVGDKRLTKSRSSSHARHNCESLKLDGTLGRGKGVEVCDLTQPHTHVELTDLSKASDRNNGSRRNTVKDGDFCHSKQVSNIHSRIGLLRSSSPSPGADFFMTGSFVKSVSKSAQSPQPLISQNLQEPPVSVVGSFHKDPDFCAVKSKERSSRSGSAQVYLARDSKIPMSFSSNLCDQSATCSESPGNRSQNAGPIELDARRLSSSPKYSKLDIGIAMNSAEENNAVLVASRNTRAMTTCTNEGSLRPVSSFNLDGGSSLAESLHIEKAAADKVLDAQENMLSGANPTDNAEHRSAATVAKIDADFDGLVEKDPSCLGSGLMIDHPKVGMDVSVLGPSDLVTSVMPKQLDFDDVEETSMNGISSPDLKEGRQGVSPEKEPWNLLEPLNLPDEEMQEVLIREEGPQMISGASHFKESDITRKALNAMSTNKELPVVQTESCILTSSLMNHSSPSQIAAENSSGSLSKEAMASKFVSMNSKLENDKSSTKLEDSFSAAFTGNGLHKDTNESVSKFTVGFPFAVPMNEVNVGLAQQAPNSISLCQNGDLLRQSSLSDGKITGFSTDFQIFKSSAESFTYDVEHSCLQLKRRKIEIEKDKILPASSNLLEKPLDSIDQRPVSINVSIEEDNPEAVLEVQHLASHQEDGIGHQYVSDSPMDEMQDTRECQTMEGSSCSLRKEEKLILDGRDPSADTLMLAEANPSGFSVDSTMRCIIDEKVESWHHQVDCGQESAEHPTFVERSTSSRRIYSGGNAKFSDGSSISPGIQCLDLMGTDEALPEFEGFIIQTDNAQPCTAGDQMDLEKMNLPRNSIDYTSLGKSRFMHSPLCYSSTPYKLHIQSLPNGLLEGFDLRTSLPLNDESPRALSDCLPNCKSQYTSSVQTLWDRINLNFGSSGNRKSLKPELPCINEENENVDEIAGTFQKDIVSEGMTGSITREPLAEIIDAKPSTSVLQDDILTDGREDFVSRESNFSGTHDKVKMKLDKQDGNRKRFTSKGKENQNISLGANGAKRTTESISNRSSRPKLSGKDSMKRGRTYSEVKSTCKNIVSNVTSFIPLVQQKQASAVITGKRDIKVKALGAAEAAKRMAEKKENERKMKKEALRLEREKLEQRNLRLQEQQKKKKEEERKKKEAEMAAKKRQREDEEIKEKERKRKRVNEVKQQQHEKIRAKKKEREIQCRATGEEVHESRKLMDKRDNLNYLQLQDNREGNAEKISETEPLTVKDSANDKTKECCLEYSESVNDCADNRKVIHKATEDDDLIIKNSPQGQSYEISPYKGSDDEDEDEDDIPNNKLIPSWASKHSLSRLVPTQKMDPETIFPPRSFCNIAEVLLPRKLQL